MPAAIHSEPVIDRTKASPARAATPDASAQSGPAGDALLRDPQGGVEILGVSRHRLSRELTRLVRADEGEVEQAVGEPHDVIERAQAVESVTTVAWARTVLGWVLLRHDPAAALAVLDSALAEARRLDYPIAVAVGLRSRAFAELIAGDTDAALATASELLPTCCGGVRCRTVGCCWTSPRPSPTGWATTRGSSWSPPRVRCPSPPW